MIIPKSNTTCFIFVFLWFSVVLVCCEDGPTLIGEVRERYRVEIGSSVKLRCHVTGTSDPENNRTLVAWTFGKKIIISNSLQIWSRFRINTKYLKIVNVKEGDAGVYTCKAFNQFGTLQINITLLIKQQDTFGLGTPPKFKKYPRRKMSFKTGETAKLKCHSTGNPDPDIQWFKDGQSYSHQKRTSVSASGWTLNLRYLNVDDSGKYSCRVSNTLGSINRTFTVNVKARIPKPIIYEPENVTVLQGMNATLICRAESVGKPVFKWKRWKRLKINSPRDVSKLFNKEQVYTSESTVMAKNEFEAILVIRNVTKKDAGNYRCVVENKHGTDEMDMYLHVVRVFNKDKKSVAATTTVAALQRNPAQTEETTPMYLIVGLTASIVVTLIFIIVLIACCRKQRKHLEKQYVSEYKPEEILEHPQQTSVSQEMQKVVQEDVDSENSWTEKSWKQQSCSNAVRTLKDVKEHLDSCFTSTKQTQCSQYCLENYTEQTTEPQTSNTDGLTSAQRTSSKYKSSSRELSSIDSNRSTESRTSCGHALESNSTNIGSSMSDNRTNENVSCTTSPHVLRQSIV